MKLLIISADHFEDAARLCPRYRRPEEGLQVESASFSSGKIRGRHGDELVVDTAPRDVDPSRHDLLARPPGALWGGRRPVGEDAWM